MKLKADESLVSLRKNPNYGASHRKVGENVYELSISKTTVVKTADLKVLQDEKHPQFEKHLVVHESGDPKSSK